MPAEVVKKLYEARITGRTVMNGTQPTYSPWALADVTGVSNEDLTEIGVNTGLLRRFVQQVFEDLVGEKGALAVFGDCACAESRSGGSQ